MNLSELAERTIMLGNLPVIYLAGPMSGIDHHNFPEFNSYARKFRLLGFPVLNPADFGSADFDIATDDEGVEQAYRNAMARDLPLVCAADVLFLLPGWTQSRGASMEYEVADGLGKLIIDSESKAEVLGFMQTFFAEETLERISKADKGVEFIRKLLVAGVKVQVNATLNRSQAEEVFGGEIPNLEDISELDDVA